MDSAELDGKLAYSSLQRDSFLGSCERPQSVASVTTASRASPASPSGFTCDSNFVSRPTTCEPASRPATCEPQHANGFLEEEEATPRPKSAQCRLSPLAANPIAQIPTRLDAGFGRGFGPCKPVSLSPHESALHTTETGWSKAEIPQARITEELLEKDKARLSRKYNATVTSRFQPLRMESARYHVKLPSTPQHMKYVPRTPEKMVHTREQDDGVSSNRSSPAAGRKTLKKGKTQLLSLAMGDGKPKTRQRVAYNIKRLEEWFLLMDYNRSGEITVRKLIIGMLRHQELFDLFYILKDGGQSDIWAMNPQDRPKVGHLSKDEMDSIRDMLTELDQDGGGSMDWPEFVDFFRKAGLLLEYSTREDLNTSHLGETDLAVYHQKQEEDRKAQQAKFFNEARRGGQARPTETRASRRESRKSVDTSDCLQAQVT